ncbi:MAG: bifunctional 2-polyprenyl-6-hydroxyphenol methylase/3-demethylubiquinol 3-O-methyltransferase UbiG [Methylacidiphilales bacterium]|nr:bifunctional 2-polyprenyl-6-hydroxyphenol methylase/3-demethylubiquinol 3-O-methyltransferase UbiG [Candidatus Methylacidiphilales bacterium]
MHPHSFDRLAHEYWEKKGSFSALHSMNSFRISMVQKLIEIKNQKILDFGCGGGLSSESLAKLGAQVTGIDESEAMIDIAKKHNENQLLPITYLTTSSMNQVNFQTQEPFDCIVAFEVLEHISPKELPQCLHNLSSILKPNGYLCITTINRTPQSFMQAIVIAEYLLSLVPKRTHQYNFFIKPSELVDLTANYAMRLVTLQGMGYLPLVNYWYKTAVPNVNYFLAFQKMP